MRKNFMEVAFVAAIALIAGINVYHAQKPVTLSDIAMENVEALADYEWVTGKGWTCFHWVYDDVNQEVFSIVKYCGDCSSYSSTEVKDFDYCTYTGMYD